ncbi:MAG TPA: Fic family protein [Verrucomicrobiae bacterium]|nr:Fic family protein [Verrucomicrobiae bacterium]
MKSKSKKAGIGTAHTSILGSGKELDLEKPAGMAVTARTGIDVCGGGTRAYSNLINPDSPEPKRTGLRYNLSPWVLGKLERLARARFDVSEFTSEDLSVWKQEKGINWMIAQSVNASSEIEGESVHADKLVLLETPESEHEGGEADEELRGRIAAIRSIYEAYMWALSLKPLRVLTYEFLLELHKRMFESTKGETAGRIKTGHIFIEGAGYHVETLPPEKTEVFLRRITERYAEKWKLARKHAEYSTFLLTAEYILDFLAIHPFADGNGRTARLLSTYLLEKSGYHFARFYPVDNVVVETRRKYYEALYSGQVNWLSEREDLTAWIEYYTSTAFTQWIRAYERVKDDHLAKKRMRS